jgi:hypothetical protein
MGRFLFNPFTQNFTVIPKPQAEGFFLLAARNGKLEWVEREDPMAKTVTIGFTTTATREVSSVGILPRVVIARADAAYVKTIEDPGTYTHEVLIDDTASSTASYAVGVYLAPDQAAAITTLPSTAITASPVADSNGDNVAFIYVMTFTGDASVNIDAYDSP